LAGLGPQRAQVRKRIEASRVTALERDLKRVLTYESDVFDAELLRAERLDPGQPPRGAGLTSTFSARARPSQLFGGVSRAFAVFPGDVHRLPGAIDIDVDWKRIGVLQCLSA
jgi:hypothetical protein